MDVPLVSAGEGVYFMKHFNVNWLEVPAKVMTAEQINSFLDKEGVKLTYPEKGNKSITSFTKLRGRFFKYHDLFCGYSENEGFFRIARTANDNTVDDEDLPINAGEAFNMLEEKFKEINGVSFSQAFGPKNHHLEYRAVKFCVPSPINWAGKTWCKFKLGNVRKADVSSAYPTELSKRVPTWRGCKTLDGYVEPTEEYPFAFYSTHHLKVLEEDGTILDSRDLENNPYYMTSLKKKCGSQYIDRFVANPKLQKTILCKVAPYSFREVMDYFYANRKEHPEYKDVMNVSIGMFHKSKSPMYSNIASVVLLRCGLNMIKRLEYLEDHDCCPLLVNTDSIAWLGDDISIAETTKYMGSFYLEHSNCEMYIVSPKCYQVKDGDEVETHWSGKIGVKHLDIPFGELEENHFGEVYVWDNNTERYVIKETLMI